MANEYAGTVIGPDGKRYPTGDAPSLTRDDRVGDVVHAFGSPAVGQAPVWTADGRAEWGAVGGSVEVLQVASFGAITAATGAEVGLSGLTAPLNDWLTVSADSFTLAAGFYAVKVYVDWAFDNTTGVRWVRFADAWAGDLYLSWSGAELNAGVEAAGTVLVYAAADDLEITPTFFQNGTATTDISVNFRVAKLS